VFCALAGFERATGHWRIPHLDVIASAVRITQITDCPEAVSQSPMMAPTAVNVNLQDISFSYPEQPQKALNGINLSIALANMLPCWGVQVAVNQRCYSY
jgi:ATP-binding cassette subfamily C protein CydC